METNRLIAIVAGVVVMVLVIVIVAVVVASNDGGGDEGGALRLDPTNAETILRGNNLQQNNVQVIFQELPSDQNAIDAFQSAADKWSSIIAGSIYNRVTLEANNLVTFCNEASLTQDFSVQGLLIAASFGEIDGDGNTLAFAGPCEIDTNVLNKPPFPTAGIMVFDTADLDVVQQDGSLEDVILHEMGHVLGIGTAWGFARQGVMFENVIPANQVLLQDPVISRIGNSVFADPTARPRFQGAEARRRFADARESSNLEDVPVEDGIFPEGQNFNNVNGQGSVDGHWNLEDVRGELMVFRLAQDMRLSAITIGSLQDLGYTVNFEEADDFLVSEFASVSSGKSSLKGSSGDGHHHDMVNDVLNFPIRMKGVGN